MKYFTLLLILFYFALGITSGFYLQDYFHQEEQPLSSFNEQPHNVPSPYDHIKENQIHINEGKVEIFLDDRQVSWARFAPTNSMDPVLDSTANSIEIVPRSPSDIHVGDIVAFTYENSLIVHRVIDIGSHSNGAWYAITKGDNVEKSDPGERSFEDIKFITVGVIY